MCTSSKTQMNSKGCTIIIAGVPDHFHYFRICCRCMYDDGQIAESSYLLKFQSILVSISVFMPHSHKRHKHKHKIDTKAKHDLSSGTCKYKTTRICLCFVFCSALGLCFDYVLMLVLMSLNMSQASLHSFHLRFVCPYAYEKFIDQSESSILKITVRLYYKCK